MKDGLVLFYSKGNIIYPVALTKDQLIAFEMLQQLLPQPIRVIFDKPQGEVENLLGGTYEKTQNRIKL